MSAETEFRALLANNAGVAALVGTRVALNGVPQDAPLPLVVYTSTHSYELALDNTILADQTTFAVQCWAETAAAADAVADAVTAAVFGAAHVVTDRQSAFDAELGIDATTLTVEWWA